MLLLLFQMVTYVFMGSVYTVRVRRLVYVVLVTRWRGLLYCGCHHIFTLKPGDIPGQGHIGLQSKPGKPHNPLRLAHTGLDNQPGKPHNPLRLAHTGLENKPDKSHNPLRLAHTGLDNQPDKSHNPLRLGRTGLENKPGKPHNPLKSGYTGLENKPGKSQPTQARICRPNKQVS